MSVTVTARECRCPSCGAQRAIQALADALDAWGEQAGALEIDHAYLYDEVKGALLGPWWRRKSRLQAALATIKREAPGAH